MDPIIYLIGAFILSLAIIYYASAIKKEPKPNHLEYLRIDVDLNNLANEVEKYKSKLEKLEYLVLQQNQKIETAEFMAHSAKMDIAKGIPIKFSEPLRVYHYQRMVPPRKENEERRKKFQELKKQMDNL